MPATRSRQPRRVPLLHPSMLLRMAQGPAATVFLAIMAASERRASTGIMARVVFGMADEAHLADIPRIAAHSGASSFPVTGSTLGLGSIIITAMACVRRPMDIIGRDITTMPS